MVKKSGFLAFFLSLLYLAVSAMGNQNERILEFDIDADHFSIVVLADEDMDIDSARSFAMKKAANKTIAKGYEYFKIKSEGKVRVIEGKKDWPSPYSFPQNLYQEQIIEKGYNRERLYHEDAIRSNSESQEGYRFDYECVKDSDDGYKACDYTNCK